MINFPVANDWTTRGTGEPERGPMSYRTIVSIAAALVLGTAAVSTDALAFRGGVRGGAAFHGGAVRGGAYRGGGVAYRGGAYRGGGYWRGGRYYGAAAVGAAAVGAAAAGSYYNSARCGYYPYPPC
jgi:hypothetical protein